MVGVQPAGSKHLTSLPKVIYYILLSEKGPPRNPGSNLQAHTMANRESEDSEKSRPRDDKLVAGGPLWPRGLFRLASTMFIEKLGLDTKHLKMSDFQISRFS